jgi:hypothetical protein
MALTTHPINTLELVRFVLDHIDADETDLKRLTRRHGGAAAVASQADSVCSIGRQLNEIDSKRRVLGGIQRLIVLRDQPMEKAVRDQALIMLQALAAPYSESPGFRDEWRSAHA